jgi:hypothetical protein
MMMYDHWSAEMKVRERLDPLTERDLELARFLADERKAGAPGLRRRVASAFVGLGLRLDPEAAHVVERWPALEVAHVRD